MAPWTAPGELEGPLSGDAGPGSAPWTEQWLGLVRHHDSSLDWGALREPGVLAQHRGELRGKMEGAAPGARRLGP